MGMEDDFLQNDVDDEKTIEYIKNYLPQELKEKFSDDEFYYFLDFTSIWKKNYLKSFRENGFRQKNMTNIWRRSKREVQKCQVLFSQMKEPLPGETQK